MNFFAHQEAARRQTWRLIFLLVLAVAAIVAAVDAVVLVVLHLTDESTPRHFVVPAPKFLIALSALPLAVIIAGMVREILAVAGGGADIARDLGARQLAPSTTDLAERRLMNVVEEMAIASGTAVPQVFVMDGEMGINAFAAGFSPNNTAITVTRGALDALNRDELQGVIGHEFSHILNGDMRLNMHVIGVLGGILALAILGRFLVDAAASSGDSTSSSSDKDSAKTRIMFWVLGYALIAIGYIGVFFARLIKAGISRQREFLADASSVQFTRDPDGIGGALAKMMRAADGAMIDHPYAEKASHMFFGEAIEVKLTSLMATHPPVKDRLQKIYGRLMASGEIAELARKGVPLAPTPKPAPGGIVEADEQEQAAMLGHAPARASPVAATSSFAGTIEWGGDAPGSRAADAGVQTLAAPAPAAVSGAVGTVSPRQMDYAVMLLATLPRDVREQLRSTQGAMLAMYGLVLARSGPVKTAQAQMLNACGVDAEQAFAAAEKLQALDKTARLPLITLAIPTLKPLSEPERLQFLSLLQQLIEADRRVTLEEFVLSALLGAALGARAERAVAVKYRSLELLAEDARLVLSLVAHATRGDSARSFAQGTMEAGLTLTLIEARSLSIAAVTQALGRLNQLAPLQKPRLVKACAQAALHEGRLSLTEAELLRAICATLDSPLPPFIGAMEYAA